MHSRTIALAIVAVVLLAACGGSDPTTTSTTEIPLEVVPRTYDQFRGQPTACAAEAPDPVSPMQFEEPADLGIDGSATLQATLATSCGDIEVDLEAALAPETVNSFVFLAEEGYFDGTVIHRLLPGFVAQGGDQSANGLGGPGYTVPDEFPPDGITYDRGVLAMANAGPGTTGSQFFVVLEDTDLPPQFSIFGRVTDGFDVLDRMQQVSLGRAPGSPDPVPSTPLETIYVDSVAVER